MKRKGKTAMMQWQKKKVHVLYAQLACQFEAENEHGSHDTGHESLRRQSYARHMIGEFAKELKAYQEDPVDFRSRILTPVLQRYLTGIPDSYTPLVRSAIAGGAGEPTITDATGFYLARDPLDPKYIPFYRRNLLYIAESRWYLGILLQKFSVESVVDFNRVRVNYDNAMENISEPDTVVSEEEEEEEGEEEEEEEDNVESPCELDDVAVQTIMNEGLEDFFADELAKVVCALSHLVCFF